MHGLTRFSLRNRALTALITIFIIVAGVISTTSLKRELIPSLQLPIIAIATQVPGASSSVVEQQVTEPVEAAARGVSGVDSITSTSSDGVSIVTVQLVYGTDLAAAQNNVQRTVLGIQSLPDNADPNVIAGSFDDFPILQLSATGGKNSDDLVSSLQDTVLPRLRDIEGVRDVQLSGVTGKQVAVELDPAKTAAAGVTAKTISDALKANGVVVPAGSITEDQKTLQVQVGSRITSTRQLSAIPLQGTGSPAAQGGSNSKTAKAAKPAATTLGAVASVTLVDVPKTGLARTDGKPSVSLAITKTPEGNAVEVSHRVEDALPQLENAITDGKLTVVFDQAPFIEQSVNDLATEGGLGLLFAVIVVLIFLLSIRLTLVTALSIPLSLLIAIIGINVAGYSLNILTLSALTIAVGRVVDDSIVVIENIKRHLDLGEPKRTAVPGAVREVSTAVIASTLATAAVFVPIGFVSGQTGELFRPFALTVAMALVASLFVALTIIPVLGWWLLKTKPLEQPATSSEPSGASASAGSAEPAPGHSRGSAAPLKGFRARRRAAAIAHAEDRPDRLQRAYLPLLGIALGKPLLTVLVAILVLGGTLGLSTQLKTDFLGNSGDSNLTVSQTLPAGTSLAATNAAAKRVEKILTTVGGVSSYQVTIGSSGNAAAALFGGGSGPNTASYSVTLADDVDATVVTSKLKQALQARGNIGEVTVAGATQGPGSGSVQIEVQSIGDADLAAAAKKVEKAVASVPGAGEVTNNLASTSPQLSVDVDRDKALAAGLSEAQIGQVVTAALRGANVGTVTIDGVKQDVVVSQGTSPMTQQALKNLVVGADGNGEIPLSRVADVKVVDEPASISRLDGKRTATIETKPVGNDLGAFTSDVTSKVDAIALPDGVTATIGGVSADQSDAFRQLGLALLAAIAIVYVIMVATFKSLLQPLLLMVSIPFAATGALLMLLATDTPLGVAALIGSLLLVGIVVTNAIVLIDLINQYRTRGMSIHDAITEGARHRLRPIIMTALATITALSPLALSVTGGGAFISQPLALVVIGGLVSSTLLTLVLVPVLYFLVERAKYRLAHHNGRIPEAEREDVEQDAAEAGERAAGHDDPLEQAARPGGNLRHRADVPPDAEPA